MSATDELIYKIAIRLLPGVGDINAKKILTYIGNPKEVFSLSEQKLQKIPDIGIATAKMIVENRNVLDIAAEEVEYIKKNNIKTYFYTDNDYPNRFRYCDDSPVFFFTKGEIDFNVEHIISVVGTRNATEYGVETCKQIISDLADLNILVISGLAYGIDTEAHKAALDNNLKTVAVLAHGFNTIYPKINYSLSEKIIKNGCLISDYYSNTEPERENFPQRNRIIAGLSDATIVIEAAQKGGALITANIANSYSREVFAIPGRIGDTFSEGCNNLIKSNQAILVNSGNDIRQIMGWDKTPTIKKNVQKKLLINLSEDESKIVKILEEKNECTIDMICGLSKMSNGKVASLLLNLELENIIKILPGKLYKLY